MTLRERAEAIVHPWWTEPACNKEVHILRVERHLREAVADALDEAAASVCWVCRDPERPRAERAENGCWFHRFGENERWHCLGDPIRGMADELRGRLP